MLIHRGVYFREVRSNKLVPLIPLPFQPMPGIVLSPPAVGAEARHAPGAPTALLHPQGESLLAPMGVTPPPKATLPARPGKANIVARRVWTAHRIHMPLFFLIEETPASDNAMLMLPCARGLREEGGASGRRFDG